MDLFAGGQDWFSSQWLSERLTLGAAIAILFLAVILAGLHLIRRGMSAPTRSIIGEVPPQGSRFARYEIGARLYHWGNFLVILALLLSGFALYSPVPVPILPAAWLLIHEVLAAGFILLLVLHIAFAFWRSEPRSMWFERMDFRDLAAFWRYYLGHGKSLPRTAKYDVWQKIYHAVLIVLALVAIVTGVSLFLSAEVLANLSHDWMRWQRLLHDLMAVSFATLVLGHVYLRLTRLNGPKLRAMFDGTITRDAFIERHDWARWEPPIAKAGEQEKSEPARGKVVHP